MIVPTTCLGCDRREYNSPGIMQAGKRRTKLLTVPVMDRLSLPMTMWAHENHSSLVKTTNSIMRDRYQGLKLLFRWLGRTTCAQRAHDHPLQQQKRRAYGYDGERKQGSPIILLCIATPSACRPQLHFSTESISPSTSRKVAGSR